MLREGVAILANDLLENPALSAHSLIAARVASVLCVPLVAFEKVLGAVYLDTRDERARFQEEDLQLLAAVAAVSALAVTNVSHLEQLQHENQRLREDSDARHDIVGIRPGEKLHEQMIGAEDALYTYEYA